MAAPTIDFAGFVYDDAGDAVSGAVVHIYDKNSTSTAREASSITTNSSGYWSYSHATPGEFDVEVVSGASKRRFKFDDKVHLSGIDVETLSVRGNEGALAAIYMYADEGDDASDQWRIDAGTDGVLAIGNDAASQGTFVDHITFTPNSTVANSTVAFKGGVTIAGDLTITGDDLVMGTNTSGHVLVADGTNYNPVAVSGDITMAANGAVTIASTAVETGMIAADAITGAKIADDAINSEHYTDGSIDTAHIADNQVTLAKMAGLARGKIIYGDASGDPAALAVGTAGYALATDGTDLAYTNSLLATDYVIGEDAQTKIDFETANEIHFDADNSQIANITSSGLQVTGTVDISLDAHIDSSPSDESVSGITATFTAGEDLVRGEVVFFKASDSKMWKAVASAAGTMPVAAMAAADISADATGKFLLYGFIADNGTFPSYTVGAKVYAPEAETSSQNVPEETAPDSDGDFVQVLGFAVTANSLLFNPSNDIIEHA